MSTIAVSPQRRTVLDTLVKPTLLTDATFALLGAAFVGALAQISWHVQPFHVPFTGQTMGVLLVGASFGLRRAIASMSLYLVAGLAGIPWFAGQASGYENVKALLGYLIGFIVASAVMSWLAAKGGDKKIWSAIPLFLIGEIAIYAIGVPWLAHTYHQSLSWGITNGLVPFLVWDFAKAVVAGTLLPGARRLVDSNASAQ